MEEKLDNNQWRLGDLRWWSIQHGVTITQHHCTLDLFCFRIWFILERNRCNSVTNVKSSGINVNFIRNILRICFGFKILFGNLRNALQPLRTKELNSWPTTQRNYNKCHLASKTVASQSKDYLFIGAPLMERKLHNINSLTNGNSDDILSTNQVED